MTKIEVCINMYSAKKVYYEEPFGNRTMYVHVSSVNSWGGDDVIHIMQWPLSRWLEQVCNLYHLHTLSVAE